MSEPIIRVENLSKRYLLGSAQERQAGYVSLRESLTETVRNAGKRLLGRETGADTTDFWALRDVSFEVYQGDVVGIVGRNGAGKSTLLKILSRITTPTAGRIHLRGRVGSLLEVGTGFHPELTGRENIYLNGAILGMSRQEITRQFDAIIAFAEVEKFLDTPVKRYSSGMYVRLAFAVAAHLNPEILIVDEVLAVGDAQFQKKCLGKMGEVAGQGRTVLFVSHNMAAVQQLCTRALLLRGGHVALDADTAVVVSQYLEDGFQSENGLFDLRKHPARSPAYSPLIEFVRLLDANGESGSSFSPSQPVTVELQVSPRCPMVEPRAAVAIEDNYGRRIMTYASYFAPGTLPSLEEPSRIVCQIPALGLGSGRYLISVSLSDRYNGLLDSVDSAAWFEIEWDNYYQNGEPYSAVYGPVLTHSFWSLKPWKTERHEGYREVDS